MVRDSLQRLRESTLLTKLFVFRSLHVPLRHCRALCSAAWIQAGSGAVRTSGCSTALSFVFSACVILYRSYSVHWTAASSCMRHVRSASTHSSARCFAAFLAHKHAFLAPPRTARAQHGEVPRTAAQITPLFYFPSDFFFFCAFSFLLHKVLIFSSIFCRKRSSSTRRSPSTLSSSRATPPATSSTKTATFCIALTATACSSTKTAIG